MRPQGRDGPGMQPGWQAYGMLRRSSVERHGDPFPVRLPIPELALVLLVGPSGAGKSTFAARHFAETEVVSSDRCRALVADDERDQSATRDAFDLLHLLVEKRLRRGRLTVVDATSVTPESRRALLVLARRSHVPAVAVVFDLPAEVCIARDRARRRQVGARAIERQIDDLHRSIGHLGREGFRHVHVFRTPEDVEGASVVRVPLPSNRKAETGPFDIIGDLHGCYRELRALLDELGWEVTEREGRFHLHHPAGRKLVFLGDLIDRGPGVVEVLQLVMDAVAEGSALAISGNHEAKLLRKLQGRDVRVSGGLQETLDQLEGTDTAFLQRLRGFLATLPHHYQLDGGRLVVAHGGLPARLQGRDSPRVQSTALYGEVSGRLDGRGLPERRDWAESYRGDALVVYGHTPVPEPRVRNGTVNIDTGCVFGGRLTALRYPEGDFVSVPAFDAYAEDRHACAPGAA